VPVHRIAGFTGRPRRVAQGTRRDQPAAIGLVSRSARRGRAGSRSRRKCSPRMSAAGFPSRSPPRRRGSRRLMPTRALCRQVPGAAGGAPDASAKDRRNSRTARARDSGGDCLALIAKAGLPPGGRLLLVHSGRVNEPRMRARRGASGSAARQEERGHCSGRESLPTPSGCLTLQRAAGQAARKPLLGRVGPTIGQRDLGLPRRTTRLAMARRT
jgi:hypothetical protein